jgi:hypothetical protein
VFLYTSVPSTTSKFARLVVAHIHGEPQTAYGAHGRMHARWRLAEPLRLRWTNDELLASL